MNTRAIITLADSNYFELLDELIDSIKSYKESESISICILDAGLTTDQLEILKKKVFSIKKAKWDIPVPAYKVAKSAIVVNCSVLPSESNVANLSPPG